MAQEGILQVAKQLGFKEMAIDRRNFSEDYWNMMHHHQDGVIAPLYFGDVVIFQYPSWNGTDYDREFADKVKMYQGTKLIIFVHDLQQLMFDSEREVLCAEIDILNKADALILPSKKMYDYLKGNGLKSETPVVFQKIWEVPGYPQFATHHNRKRMIFTGHYERFPFLGEYNGKTVLEQFDGEKPIRENSENFVWKGLYEPHRLMREIAKGGFGLVWCDEEYFKRYYSLNQPHKLGFNLAAGIPVIVRSGCVHEEFIRSNGLGYVVHSLEEADDLVQNTPDGKYEEMVNCVAKYQPILLNGIYTKKLLVDAVLQVMEK